LSSAWFPAFHFRPSARIRLFCFPHAGGASSAFRHWSRQLPDWIDVVCCHLPGREERVCEEPLRSLERVLDAIEREISPFLDLPHAIFGHSMGALVGFGVARRLRRFEARAPRRVIVSACPAPHLERRFGAIHDLPDGLFMQELERRHLAIPETIRDPEMLEIILSALRADLAVYDSAVYEAEPPLGCPISVYGGQDDPLVSENELRAWSAHTQAGMRLNMFPGDHFYLQSALPDLLEHIRTDLASCQKAGW